MSRPGRLASLFVLGLASLLAAGCGARQPAKAPPTTPGEPLVWPRPPAEPRIRYVRSVSGAGDAGIEKSFFGRLAGVLFGAEEERLVRPAGVAERDGVLYVADAGAQALWIFDRPNQRIVKVERITAALVSPVAVALGPEDTVFLADSALKKVFLLDRRGKLVRIVVEEGLARPAGVAYDPGADRLYVADSAGHRIAVYRADGSRLLAWGARGHGPGELNYPTHVALDRTGALLVTDALNFRVQAFDPTGRLLWTLGRHGDGSGDFAAPKGVAIDSMGHLYVADALFDTVQIFDPGGVLLLAVGERGVEPGQFWLPAGVFITPYDRIYVADSYNRRVQVFDLLPGPD